MSPRPPTPSAAFREAAVRDFVEFIDEARWHNFPVSVKEFRALAETYIATRVRLPSQRETPQSTVGEPE